jgi:hypothetical protein
MSNHKPSKKMLNAHAALIAKTAKKILPELREHDHYTRKADMVKFEKNINLLLNNEYSIMPVVGMGCTTGAGSDCYPHSIVEVAQDLSYIVTTSDSKEATEKNDYYSNQDFTYTTNWNGVRTLWTLRKDGRYYRDGAGMGRSYNSIAVGHRRYYQDPSF